MSNNVETNDKGQFLLDPLQIAETGDSFTRYNGGWLKTVTGINKAKTDGYSLIGDFVKEGMQWLSPGLLLDKSIGGGRRSQKATYTLFMIGKDGSIKELASIDDSRDWAVKLWGPVQTGLAALQSEATPKTWDLSDVPTEVLLRELEKRNIK